MSARHRYRPGDEDAVRPPERTFTGDVRIEGYARRADPSRLIAATVRYAAGARTPWKTNPAGQTIVVTAGRGRAQVEGGPVFDIAAGDTIWCPPRVRHWEGAAPDVEMTCVVQHEDVGGAAVDFLDAVTDDVYDGPTR